MAALLTSPKLHAADREEAPMSWLGPIPPIRHERHFDGRVVRTYAERPRTFNGMLADAVARNPAGEAIVSETGRLSYRDLGVIVARIAGGLSGLGIAKGDRVAIIASNVSEVVLILMATMRLGAVAVLLSPRESQPALSYMLNHSGAEALVYEPAFAGLVPDPQATPELRTRIIIGAAGTGEVSVSQLAAADPVPEAAVAEEDTAVILYTSGTTGRPKGAMITHLGLVHAAMIYQTCMALTAEDRSVVVVPMSHVTALTAGIGAMVRAAGTLIISSAFKADDFVRLAAAERMTHTVMVPAMYNLILMSPALAGADLSHWRIGGYGGAPMPEVTIRRLAERVPDLKLMNAYGSTETTGPVVLMPPSETASRRTSVGRAVPVTELLVMDDDANEVAAGETGEIWLRAPNVVVGYWRDPAATAESFVAGYWRSGDLGSVDGDGYLTLLDRKKDMINRGGYKIFSVEVENALAAHPSVVEAAVVAKPCPVLGERVHAFVVARSGEPV
ncbi:MAG TPA: AMP-binding protein, partial [Hyphomicrobiaceae bacterium]|nr:AMP-binding protein [Hyphomicrobiaceae bacterium]